jgi:hypothetical protein
MRRADSFEKDQAVLREGASVYDQHRSTRGALKDYSMKHKVTMEWDLTPVSKRDRIFRLVIGNSSVLLDWDELQRLGRWV